MGIVSYHARIDEKLLEEMQLNPDLFWELPDCSDSAGPGLLYLDKDWMVLSWLLSAKAREEQKDEVVTFAVIANERHTGDKLTKPAWQAAKVREAAKRGFELVDTESMPDDPALTAIQGRGPRDTRLQIGYGPRTFIPAEVAELSTALDRITEADLRKHFDPVVMESLDVEGILWTEEEPFVLDQILIPLFDRLKVFYRRAARACQHVLVVHGGPEHSWGIR